MDGAGACAVAAVAHDGVADGFHVDAYLVFASGVEFDFHECAPFASSDDPPACDGELAFG